MGKTTLLNHSEIARSNDLAAATRSPQHGSARGDSPRQLQLQIRVNVSGPGALNLLASILLLSQVASPATNRVSHRNFFRIGKRWWNSCQVCVNVQIFSLRTPSDDIDRMDEFLGNPASHGM
jgi:hypothetical protein